jgi:hypothetical protein
MTELEEPWQYDRRVKKLLEHNMDEDEPIRFGIEGMDGQLIIALDERLLVVKPGFVRGPDFGGLVATIYYSDITSIEVKPAPSNQMIRIHASTYQLNESHAQNYQGNRVTQAKDFFLSSSPDTILITRWGLDKYKPHFYMLGELAREARED